MIVSLDSAALNCTRLALRLPACAVIQLYSPAELRFKYHMFVYIDKYNHEQQVRDNFNTDTNTEKNVMETRGIVLETRTLVIFALGIPQQAGTVDQIGEYERRRYVRQQNIDAFHETQADGLHILID